MTVDRYLMARSRRLKILPPTGRSSRHGFERHALMHAERYARAVETEPEGAGRARLLRFLGRGEEALAGFSGAIDRDPLDAAAHAWRWEWRLAATPRAISFSDIDRAIALEPGNPWWRAWRGAGRLAFDPRSFPSLQAARHAHGSVDRSLFPAIKSALHDLDAALALDETCLLAHVVSARALDALGQPRPALRAMNAALRLGPKEAWLYWLRSELRLRLGDREGFVHDCEAAVLRDEGVAYFETAPSRKHKTYWMLVLRSENRRTPEVGDFNGSLEDLESAVALKPACSYAWAYLSRARMNAPGPGAAAALEAVERALGLRPDCGWFHIWKGQILGHLGDAAGALGAFNRGLALDPDYELGYAWRGGTLRSLGRPRQALRDLDLAAKLSPDNAWVANQRSLVLRAQGRLGEALSALDAARRIEPKFAWCSKPEDFPKALAQLARAPRSASARAWSGDIRARLGDLAGAKREFDRALRLEPAHPWALAWRAEVLEKMGRSRQALADLTRVLGGSAGSAEAWSRRGRLRQRLGDSRGALADYRRALALNPKLAWLWTWKSETEASLRRWRAAEADCGRALELDPAYGRHLLRSGLRLLAGDLPGGWSDLMRAYELSPSFMFSYAEGRKPGAGRRTAGSSEDFLDSRRLLRSAEEFLKARPECGVAWAWSGLLKRRICDYAGAVASLDRAWSLGVRTSMVLTWRGEARLQAGDAGGMADLERALTLPCGAWNFAWCGRAKVAFGRDPAALRRFDKAIALEPGNGWYHAWRGEAKRLLGVQDGLFDDFDRALALDPGYGYQAWVRTWRGLACVQARRFPEALADFNAALRESPDYALALMGRSRAYRESGRLGPWIVDLDRAAGLDAKHVQAFSARPPEEVSAMAADLAGLLRREPENAAAWRWRGYFLLLLERRPQAGRCLDEAARLDGRSPWGFAWQGLLSEGRAAVRAFDRALKVAPENALVLAWRAKARLGLGDARGALKDLDLSARLDDRFASVIGDRGRLKLMLGNASAAAADLERAVVLDRGDAGAWVDLSVARERSGQAGEARAALRRARELDLHRASARLAVWRA